MEGQDPQLNPGAGAGDPPSTPPAPDPGAGTGGNAPGAGDPQGGEPQDIEGYKRLVPKLRDEVAAATREARANRKALEEAQAKLKGIEDAQKSEAEKLAEQLSAATKRAEDLERDARSRSVRFAVGAAARDLGFANPDVAYRLLDTEAIEFDEHGEPVGVREAVKGLAEREPYLVAGANGHTPPPPSPAANRPGGLTPEQERERRDEFRRRSLSRF